ncbi:MAG: 3'-5' exonuclease domain-containing protein 2 [Candidatus Accumulibacter phosphatis]|jgi:ribonuclease D|uniref:3'-5' exonuclease domain-containing protein 2 n=1 Tax=Candidatus Accumulibacter sp. ACC012 TaxID=2823332 RepID=UPI0025BA08DE|nr:3'-5' exonuclease domain-containing protein 2 [Candidatus Accumulibacter sp. ACC012]
MQQMTDATGPQRPTREEIAQLPPFAGLTLDRIHLLKTPAQFEAARGAILGAGFIGFDTESKPTFAKGEPASGPHVVQFALREQAFIVRVDGEAACEFIKSIVESEAVVKIGFGLKSDRAVLLSKLGARIRAMVDLADALRRKGIRQTLGAKAAVAMVLGQRLQKSRSVTTSNWARQTLLPNQLLYAANDAYAALAVFYALDLHLAPVPAAETLEPAEAATPVESVPPPAA